MATPNREPHSKERTQERWQRLLESLALGLLDTTAARERADPGSDSRSIEERLIQAIWSSQFLRAGALVTASGKRVEVAEPGRWNTSRGPDFQDARLVLAGQTVEGDIEVHVDSADWVRHRHHQDFTYNRTIAHVVLRSSDDRPYEEKQNGERLERIVLEPALEPDLETLRRTVNLDEYPYGTPADLGLCHREFAAMPEEQLREFLHTAGLMRIEERIARYESQLASVSFPQLVYQALMVGQGYRSNKTLYFLLSKRVPLRELHEHTRGTPEAEREIQTLSILLHTAQLFPAQADAFAEASEETKRLVDAMRKHWALARPYFADRLMPPTKRWYAGMRPAGFPPRRLAAVATLVHRMINPEAPLFTTFCKTAKDAPLDAMTPKQFRAFLAELAAFLVVDDEKHYFARHFTLGGKEQKPQALLGAPAALTQVFNVLLPVAILYARREQDRALESQAFRILARFPALDDNQVTRFMQRRLLGDDAGPKGLFGVELMQQALFRIFGDCCAHNERTCNDCTLFALGERLRAARFAND